MYKNCLAILVLCLVTTTVFSQKSKKFSNKGTVNEQFDYLYKNSNKYQTYKVVEANWILKLKKNVSDSIKASKVEINNNYKTIKEQKNNISNLNNSLTESKNIIDKLNNENQSISLFGIQIGKGVFKTIMFSIIGGLIALLIVFIGKFKQSNSVTKEIKARLTETEEEFENHRKVALEREQKVRRQLQDELNKQKKD
ncbi:hypothetical protein SAMN05444411_110111 [Lutibacter oricola]|uniref:tRNA (Guanine-N1)-methyltransferase n=1 Tax=Lutibacter oricola TaxID=762486 RepID=A0A1H3F5H9_9FLAO|nr:hypothetical protein [Lutibacter oricola]SDX85598.1 hypothetical protein SAMN05444411_110111 [Lutibacter oricola]